MSTSPRPRQRYRWPRSGAAAGQAANAGGRWRTQLSVYGAEAFHGNGNSYTHEAKVAELERIIGQYAEIAVPNLAKDAAVTGRGGYNLHSFVPGTNVASTSSR